MQSRIFIGYTWEISGGMPCEKVILMLSKLQESRDTNMIETTFTVISVLIALGAFIWGIVSYRNQIHAQLFLEFTKRFEEVMQSFPKNAWSARLDIDGTLPTKSKELSLSVLRYLNLCGEEYYLYKKGWMNKGIWKIWEAELIRTLQTPLFIREWKNLSREFEAYPAFKEYVDKIQKDTKQ
jgi:hypothetical protein